MNTTSKIALTILAISAYSAPVAADLTWGSMSTAPGEARGVYDWELADFIAAEIGLDRDILIVNTACYGGDFLENFDGTGGTGFDEHAFTNTTIISGASAGKETLYGEYHRNAAMALKRGDKASDVHTAASHANEDPQIGGGATTPGDKVIGGMDSTHVLVWAGQPEDPDADDALDIAKEFAGDANTTVDILFGSAAASTKGNVTLGAATRDNLKSTLDKIGNLINGASDPTKEQFILFITDHGDIHNIDTDAGNKDVIGGFDIVLTGTEQIVFDMPLGSGVDVLGYMQDNTAGATPNNNPTLSFVSPLDPIQIQLVELSLQSSSPVAITPAAPEWTVVQLEPELVLPQPDPLFQYILDLPSVGYFDADLSSFTADFSLASGAPLLNAPILWTEWGSGVIQEVVTQEYLPHSPSTR